MKEKTRLAILEATCRRWQKLLRLEDWDIDLLIVRWHDLDAQGECHITPELKHARIRIRDGRDMPAHDPKAHQDMEGTLVHELIHLHMHGAVADSAPHEVVALEQAIVALEKCLIALDRRDKGRHQ